MSLKFQPQEVPAEPVAGFGAVPAERLQPSALRMRFQESRIWTPDTRLDEQRLHEQAFLPAAVLIPVRETATGPEVVLTRQGSLRGRSDGSLRRFLGIPYARAPLGALRWRAPQRPAS